MARVVHFEISCDVPERAVKFYEEVFGWTNQRWMDQPYWLIMTGDRKTPGIDGAIQPRTDFKQPVINTIQVDSIDETIAKIKEKGGTVLTDKMDVPKVGVMVYFKDPDGNISGAMQFDRDAMM
ncbi:MAG: Glyoxalase-like domain protein [Methanomassiliicoccales archaeon PtaU1.Bin124]|nr:MAG: Glyoxalase-like domain protein [Methanomassiliicoccales archaeon PtaU1.Bin124]